MVLNSECECIVYFMKLTIPFEDVIEEAFERKKLKYAEVVAKFVAKSTTMLPLDFGFQGWSLKGRLLKKRGFG